MVDISTIEALIQSSYGADGYHVSRVTGKALIVTLPAAGQNIDELMIDLRAHGCAVHFEMLNDETPPKVELYVHPNSHQVVSDEEEKSGIMLPPREKDEDPFVERIKTLSPQKEDRAVCSCCCSSHICAWVLVGILLFTLAIVANLGLDQPPQQA